MANNNLEDRQDSPPQSQPQAAGDANFQQQQQQQPQQGVLWKRRDVFKNKWRPRWFVLQPEEAVLTYYLLSRTDAGGASTISTPMRRNNNNNNTTNISTINNIEGGAQMASSTLGGPTPVRPGNASMHSAVSELTNDLAASTNQLDYDVIPRGAIYLAGCQVSANDNLSVPQEGLFAFTIVPPQANENECHLAARTEEARDAWVATLTAACNGMDNNATTAEGEAESGEANGEASTSNGDANERMAASSSAWKSLSPPETIFDNVSTPLAERLEQSLETHLELCEDAAPALQWTPVFQDRNGVSAYQRQDLHGRTMMKSTATIPHHPKQVLNLLLDSQRRQNFEPSVSVSERLEVVNSFTFMDYYAYTAVWPLSARDFAVVLHWQALQREVTSNDDNGSHREEALVLLAFSCTEANNLKEQTSSNVRATLHASFYLLKLVPGTENSQAKCHLTRILSYDLGGQIPQNLATTVLMQQAGLPGVLSKHLRRVEPTPEERLSTSPGGQAMTNEEVIKDVVEAIMQKDDTTLVSSARRRLSFDTAQAKAGAPDTPDESNPTEKSSADVELSIPVAAAILLAPLILHRSATWASLSAVSDVSDLWFVNPAMIFCAAAFFALRYVVLQSLGAALPQRKLQLLQSHQGGPVTCQLSVDLKGVLRFVSMKKEEQKESAAAPSQQSATPAEVSVVHIVAAALARAMQIHSDCWKYRRVSIPYLWIGGFYKYPSSSLDLSVSMASGRMLSLEDFRYSNVQEVANAMSGTDQKDLQNSGWMTLLKQGLEDLCSIVGTHRRHGRCLIVLTEEAASEEDKATSGTGDAGNIDMTLGKLPDDLDVLVMLGGIRLQRDGALGSPLRTSQPKPMLSLSLTINTASVFDVAKCRLFAEDLHKLVQFPELCED